MPDPRTLLDAERRETLARLATLTGDFDALVEASEGSNADDEHDPEGATITFELAGVLIVGLWSVLQPSAFHDKTVWSHFG